MQRQQNVQRQCNGNTRLVAVTNIKIKEKENTQVRRKCTSSCQCYSFCMRTSSSEVRGSEEVNSNKRWKSCS